MDLPRDSSDIQIALACQVCNGNGGHGSRTRDGGNPHQPCTSCSGTGWTIKRTAEISAMELARLAQRLPQLATLPVAGTSFPSSTSITGTVMEAGDDDEGTPRITIHSTREDIANVAALHLYQKSTITFSSLI